MSLSFCFYVSACLGGVFLRMSLGFVCLCVSRRCVFCECLWVCFWFLLGLEVCAVNVFSFCLWLSFSWRCVFKDVFSFCLFLLVLEVCF